MNFLKYKNADNFLEMTNLSIEDGLAIVEAELKKRQKIRRGKPEKTKIRSEAKP